MTDAITAERWIPCEEDGTGHSFGEEELALVTEVLRTGVLIASDTGFTRRLERGIEERYGVAHAIACSSGSTALQAALAALELDAGAEVITTPLTDIGGISPILQEGLIPVFADVDPVTGNLDPASVEQAISPRTSAIVVTHLVGLPCDMTAIMAIAERHGLAVLEDCAQAYDARHSDTPVGTFGAVGTFSTQQTKHISAGEGGLLITNDDDIARALRSWVNKGVASHTRSRSGDHPIVGMNARMSELQAAVAVAQLGKLDRFVERRITMAEGLTRAWDDLPGISGPAVPPGDVHTYWKYLLTIDPDLRPGLRDRLAAELADRRAIVTPCYLHIPLFGKTLFTRHRRRLVGDVQASFLDPARDDLAAFPGTKGFIDSAVVMWWNERISESDVARIADLVRTVAAE